MRQAPAAFVTVNADGARQAAAAADSRRAAGRSLSALDGIPISLKDLFDVRGEATRAASKVLADAPPVAADAPAVARLRAAGLVFVGRTQMSEFAFTGIGLNPHHPPLANPLDPERAPGGSSGGAAASVALGQACMGLGTDTGGSVRIPAAFMGLAGFKPTQARVSREGVLPLAPSLDSVGPIARTVADCRAIDAIIADEPPEPASPRSGRPRLALPDKVVLEGLDEPVGTAFAAALRRLEAAGAEIVELAFPELEEIPALNRGGAIANAEAYAWHRRAGWLGARALYDPEVLARIEIGAAMTAADYLDLLAGRRSLMLAALARTSPFDAVVFPTSPIAPPRLQDLARPGAFQPANALVLRNASLVNFLGRCAVTLPMGSPDAPFTGLTLMGEPGGDGKLFDLALTLEGAAAGPR